jgi:RNA polymerase sigma-70 factor (ECF subfamily)
MESLMIEEDNGDPIEETMSSIATSLLQRACRQDEESWRLLVEFHAPLVYSWCRMRGLDAETARDVGQDVFIAVSRNLQGFERKSPGGTLRGWIRSITENKIRDHWRKTNAQPPATGGSEVHRILREFPEPDDSSLGNDAIENSFLAQVLNYAKEHIQPIHWTVFWQLAVEEKSASEVADLNGLERAHVYVIKSRVLGQLRNMFPEAKETM